MSTPKTDSMIESKNKTKTFAGLKGKRVGVFVDDSNLYHGFKKYGWRIDINALKTLFDKHSKLLFINYYIAIPEKSDNAFKGTEEYIKKIEASATIITKPLKYTRVAGKIIKKADVDVEIVLDVVRKIDQLDLAVILSGDSDYLELKNYVTKDRKKEILFMS